MLRLYKHKDCSQFKDFPNDLFRRSGMICSIDFEADKVIIGKEEYGLSNILHLSGSGSNANSLEITQLIGLKSKIKKGLQNLLCT